MSTATAKKPTDKERVLYLLGQGWHSEFSLNQALNMTNAGARLSELRKVYEIQDREDPWGSRKQYRWTGRTLNPSGTITLSDTSRSVKTLTISSEKPSQRSSGSNGNGKPELKPIKSVQGTSFAFTPYGPSSGSLKSGWLNLCCPQGHLFQSLVPQARCGSCNYQSVGILVEPQ